MLSKLRNLRKDEAGATVIEYSLIVALFSVAIIVAYAAVGTGIGDTLNTVTTKLQNAD